MKTSKAQQATEEPDRWTDQRLDRLFRRYNQRYWSGRLPPYSVRVEEPNPERLGFCDWKMRTIFITAKGRSDRDIRSTVLHEMCHAAAPGQEKSGCHGYRFWSQVEMLLRKRAPITVTNSEAPGVHLLGGSIPARFPFSRKIVERLELKRQRKLLRMRREVNGRSYEVTDRNIIDEFGDDASRFTWQKALWFIGNEWGLLDVGGNPKNRWAARIIEKGRKVHTKARREYLFDEKLRTDPVFRNRVEAKLLAQLNKAEEKT